MQLEQNGFDIENIKTESEKIIFNENSQFS